MTCEHVTASLHDFVAHTLSPEESASVVEHISHCPSCARMAGEYELIVRAAQTLTEIWQNDRFTVATLSVAVRAIRTLVAAGTLPSH